jgi:hypothetical protein
VSFLERNLFQKLQLGVIQSDTVEPLAVIFLTTSMNCAIFSFFHFITFGHTSWSSTNQKIRLCT